MALLAPVIRQSPIKIELPWWSTLSLDQASVTSVQVQVAGNTKTIVPGAPAQVFYFDNPGDYTAQYTVNLSDGTSFIAKSSVKAEVESVYASSVKTPTTSAATGSVPPIYVSSFPRQDDISFIDSMRITADVPFQGYEEPVASLGRADVLYFYGEGRRQIIRPVILLDGFDPGDARSAHYGLYFRKLTYGTPEKNLGDNLRRGIGISDKQHDVIVLNFPYYLTVDVGCRNQEVCIRRQFGQTKDDVQCLETRTVQICNYRDGGADYIERNAMVLVKLIQMTNQQMQANGSSEKITLIGPSMGGLIARYALRYMEQNGMNHNTKLWFLSTARTMGQTSRSACNFWSSNLPIWESKGRARA